MNEKLISERQKALMREAHLKLKEAFPDDNLQVCFNLSGKFQNMNYNIKASGIDTAKP